MSTRQDYITAIGNFVGGDLPLGETEKIVCINRAVKRYSADRPRLLVADMDGDGGFDYAIAGLTEWNEAFSSIKSVEYPVDDTKAAAAILQEEVWQTYQKPAGKVLRFLEDVPAANEDIRITYTALHLCTDAQDTIPIVDAEAVQMLAAALFCTMLATYYSQDQDSTIAADSVDHKSKAGEYSRRAKAYRAEYFDHLKIKEGGVIPASVTRDQDKSASWGADHMTHPRRRR